MAKATDQGRHRLALEKGAPFKVLRQINKELKLIAELGYESYFHRARRGALCP